MIRHDRIRRQWTHRRLGLGAAVVAERELARTEALLTAVGARRTTSGGIDGFEAALFDYACDIDLVTNVAAIDATPIPIASLRAQVAPRRPKRGLSWRVLIPTASTALAAIVTAMALVLAVGSTTTSPAMSATAESQLLLSHADKLLTAAQSATANDRAKLVTEAKADLSHVSELLPLAPATDRRELRARMQLLDNRARPLASPPPPQRSSAGDTGDQPRGARPERGGGTATPQPQTPVRQSPASGTGPTTQSGPPRSGPSGQTTGQTSTLPSGPGVQRPPPRQPPGGAAPPPSQPAGGSAPASGTAYSGTYQQPHPGGDLPPPR